MLINLLYFIVDKLRKIKKNNESQILNKADRYRKIFLRNLFYL